MESPQDLQKTLGLFQLLAFGVAGVLGASWIYTIPHYSPSMGQQGCAGILRQDLGLQCSETERIFRQKTLLSPSSTTWCDRSVINHATPGESCDLHRIRRT